MIELSQMILDRVYADDVNAEFLFPYEMGQAVSYFMEQAQVLEQEYLAEGVRIKVNCHKADAAKYAAYKRENL